MEEASVVGRKKHGMPMIDICCITNRHLSVQEYFSQIEQIACAGPKAVIVREKDLPESEYEQLAARVMHICTQYHVPCILHTYTRAAVRLGAKAIHLPLYQLQSLSDIEKSQFSILGASVHSVEEALAAEDAGAHYIMAGHIYATDCKKGLPPRGLVFLEEICKSVSVPVYALGGIHSGNAQACIQAGARGVCIMSECMKHRDLQQLFSHYC